MQTNAGRGNRARFATTRWSLVLAVSDGADPTGEGALATLCELYWFPIYSFIRRSGRSADVFVRRLDQLEATAIDGTDDGHSPFFSPDGRWLGFQSGGVTGGPLRKVLLAGGTPPTTVCEATLLFGASWSVDDTIVYAIEDGGLWRVPAAGGVPEALTTVDPKRSEYSHRLPHFLPDGQSVIFTITSSYLPKWEEARLVHLTLSTGERRDLGPGADARYVSSGHLVFARAGTLVAAPFNASTRDISASSITMLSDLMQAANMANDTLDTGAGQFSLSLSGSLVYLPGGLFPDAEYTIVSADRRGRARALPNVPPRPYFAPLLSPDGTRLVVWTQGRDRNVWTYDLARSTLSRLTTEGRNHRAIWTPDGTRITFSSAVDGTYNLFWMPADGSGPAERLTSSPRAQEPSSWSPDSRTLVLLEQPGPGAVSSWDAAGVVRGIVRKAPRVDARLRRQPRRPDVLSDPTKRTAADPRHAHGPGAELGRRAHAAGADQVEGRSGVTLVRGHVGHDLPAVTPIDPEVRVSGQQLGIVHRLGHTDECGIGEAGRHVRVLLHELHDGLDVRRQTERNGERLPAKQIREGCESGRPKQVEGL